MRVSDYTYRLPEERIALHPPKKRGASRLLVLDKSDGAILHKAYSDMSEFLEPGDVIVLNDTKVIKARLRAKNEAGKNRELLLLEDHHNTDFTERKVLYRGTIHEGEKLTVDNAPVRIIKVLSGGIAVVKSPVNLLELAEKTGTVPLPPYMHRDATKEDTARYQTVFARQPGSVAAPTASLNFTEELQNTLLKKGVRITYLTLHVGLGTFLPIRSDNVEAHEMHSEYFEIPQATVQAIQACKKDNKRIIAVGTTVTRTLEYAHKDLFGTPKNLSGEANIFIYPGYKFKVVDALLTNFHAPKSTVLMMAAAFAGWDHLRAAYEMAIEKEYAFLSYGDSILIL